MTLKCNELQMGYSYEVLIYLLRGTKMMISYVLLPLHELTWIDLVQRMTSK